MSCTSCEDGEHEECENPEETWQEWDTGALHVKVCCCGPPDPPFDTREERDAYYADDKT